MAPFRLNRSAVWSNYQHSDKMSRKTDISAIDFARQPAWFRWLNRTWKAAGPLGARTNLEKDSIIKAARRTTGLNDLGQDFWEEPLDRLLASVREEASLHAIGRFITRQRLINLLSVRLRAEYYFSKHPEILEQELYPVSVIVGLQRTGTTKLQRLLAADPDTRALLSWEALNPAPIKNDSSDGRHRIKAARMSEKALKVMSPGFFAIHPVEHLAPEEDVLLLDTTFLSTTAEATMHVPSYAAWLETIDQTPAYAYMARLLKLLQWQRPGKRWVLKTPHHLEFLPVIEEQLGDVQFIWTHRNVCESIPSFLSMVAYSRKLFSDEVTAEQVAAHWVRKTGYMLSKALDYHADGKENLFTHVFYNELVRDAIGQVGRIYTYRGETISGSVRQKLEENLSMNPQGKYGRHRYSLEDFGLDSETVEMQMNAYREFQASLNGKI
jgi:hypothetical protein